MPRQTGPGVPVLGREAPRGQAGGAPDPTKRFSSRFRFGKATPCSCLWLGRLHLHLLVVLNDYVFNQKHLAILSGRQGRGCLVYAAKGKPKNQESERGELGRTTKPLLNESWSQRCWDVEPGAKRPVPSVIRTNAPTIWVPAECRGQAERRAGPQNRKRLPLAGRREAGSRALRAGRRAPERPGTPTRACGRQPCQGRSTARRCTSTALTQRQPPCTSTATHTTTRTEHAFFIRLQLCTKMPTVHLCPSPALQHDPSSSSYGGGRVTGSPSSRGPH